MARGRNKPKEKKPDLDFRSVSWVINSMSDGELETMDNMVASGDFDYWHVVASMVDEGFKFSLRWDDYSDCVQCTAVNLKAEGKNSGKGLSGRSSAPDDAMLIVAFKFGVLAEGDLSQYEVETGRGVRG